MVGIADSVLIRSVSIIQSVVYREVPLYSSYAAAIGRMGTSNRKHK